MASGPGDLNTALNISKFNGHWSSEDQVSGLLKLVRCICDKNLAAACTLGE